MDSRQRRCVPLLLALASGVVFILHLLPDTGRWEPSMAEAAATETLSGMTFPAHAMPRPGGRGWECRRGYRRDGERCVQVHVPPHAFLDYFGHDWECERGYRRDDDRCVTVHPPSHAFLDYSGHDWECERGYQQEGNRCITIHVPSHAFLDYSGHAWLCERGYQQADDRCVPLHPEQASRAYAAAAPAGETLSDEALTQLATEVYTNREGPHDQQTIGRLQRQLHQVGYDPGPIDGLLGPLTLEALRQFLTDRDLVSGTGPYPMTSPASDS